MFWGVTLVPGQPCTKVLDNTVCLSMAALESRQNIGSGFTQVVIESEGTEHLLCTLMSGVIFQQYMNVTLSEGEKVTLSVEGTGMVHLTGFTVQKDETHLGYGAKVAEEDYYDDDDPVEEEHFTVKMEDSRDLTGDWDSSSDVQEVLSESSYADQPPHVIAVTDPEPSEANQMESPWQKVTENAIVPPQADYHDQPIAGALASQANSGQIPPSSPMRKDISNCRNQFVSSVDMRRTLSFSASGQSITLKNRKRIMKPKAASAHKAEEEAIEARRRRWRLAKREQRKKIKDKIPYDKFYYQSNNQDFFSSSPGTSVAGLPQDVHEPVDDFYQITATSSESQFESGTSVLSVQDDIKTNLNTFGNT